MNDPSFLEKKAGELGLSLTFLFVPFSQSRNARTVKYPADLSLNWKVQICDARLGQIYETDYSAGVAHCRSYQVSSKPTTVYYLDELRQECERGYYLPPGRARMKTYSPRLHDVWESLLSDAEVIHYASFTSWASDQGYDPNSRQMEATYKSCLALALALHAAIGCGGLKALQEALTQDVSCVESSKGEAIQP